MLLLKEHNDEFNEYESARSKPLTAKQINGFKRSLLNIARTICPKDTRNMAENAIFAQSTINGFKIVWDDSFAYYLPYVDKGINPIYPYSKKVQSNKGFVAKSIAFMHAYCGLFLYGEQNKIKKRYGEDVAKFYFSNYSKGHNAFNKTKRNIVREAPLFIEMLYDNLKGVSPQQLVKGKGGMMRNLIKSLKLSITDKNKANELHDFIKEFESDYED